MSHVACNVASTSSDARFAPARYRFSCTAGGWRKEVIVDVRADGKEEWSEQYPGELRWYPFEPTPADRAIVDRLRQAPNSLASGSVPQ